MKAVLSRRDVASAITFALLFPIAPRAVQSPSRPTTIAGTWMYRSYLNSPTPVGSDPQNALADIFGEGVFIFATPTPKTLSGTFDMGGNLVLDLNGEIRTAPDGLVTLE